MTDTKQQQTAPGWASQIAVGMYIAAVGLVVVGIGVMLGVLPLTGVAVLVTALGAAIALMGGASYFMKVRR